MIVHPIGAEVKSVSGLRDAGTKSLLGIRETQRTILAYKRTVDVVDVLGELAVGTSWVQDHHGTTMHDEANLPPERTECSLGEVQQHLPEEHSGKRDVIDGFESLSRW